MQNRTNLQKPTRNFLSLFSKAFLAFSFFFFLTYPHLSKATTIAICQIVEHPALEMNLKGILDELKAQGYSEENGTEIIIENAQGNILLLGQISQRLASLDADAYVAIGTQAAQSLMSSLRSMNKPLVFSTVTDPKGAKLVQNYEHPEGYVTGVSNATDLLPQFEMFRELVPGLSRLGVIYNPGEANSLASLREINKVAKSMDITVVTVAATKTSEVIGAAQSLIGKVDAYFIDNDNTALASFEGIVKVGLGVGIPVFVSDTDMVERGALAALGPNQFELGKVTGSMVTRLLKGEEVNSIPVYFPQKLDRVVNDKVAKQLGIETQR